jgi:hypothetical protein
VLIVVDWPEEYNSSHVNLGAVLKGIYPNEEDETKPMSQGNENS